MKEIKRNEENVECFEKRKSFTCQMNKRACSLFNGLFNIFQIS